MNNNDHFPYAPATLTEQSCIWTTCAIGLACVLVPTMIGWLAFVIASVFTVGVFMQGGR